jgi:DNA-binding transcriptional MerR regulator
MAEIVPKSELPPIPAKRYFTIGEVSEMCGVKPHVLRYWEQEFTQLKPVKRRGNRRYYQHHEVVLVRRIRELLYEQGFTINGARQRLTEDAPMTAKTKRAHLGGGELRSKLRDILVLLRGAKPSSTQLAADAEERASEQPLRRTAAL